MGYGEGAGGGEPRHQERGPRHARTGRRAEDGLHVGVGAEDDGGNPDEEGVDPELRGFGIRGYAGEHIEDEAEAARDLACAGEVGKEGAIRNPLRDQENRRIVVDDVGEADGDDPEAEVEAGEAEGARGGEESEARAGSEIGEPGEERPSAGEEDGGFAVAQVDAQMRRAGEEIGNLEQLPEGDAGEQDAYGPAGGSAEEEAEGGEEFEGCGDVGEGGAGWEPWGDGLPDEGEIAADEAEDADAEESESTEDEGGLLGGLEDACVRRRAGDGEDCWPDTC